MYEYKTESYIDIRVEIAREALALTREMIAQSQGTKSLYRGLREEAMEQTLAVYKELGLWPRTTK